MFFYLLLAWIIGSIPFGVLFSQWVHNVNIQELGSGNIGMSNVLRNFGYKGALFTLVGDAGKGWLMVVASPSHEPWSLFWVSMAVVLGHCYSVFLKGNGGKGVATALGVLLFMSPFYAFIMIGLWIFVQKMFHKSSLASLVTVSTLIPYMLIVDCTHWMTFLGLIAIILFRHKENIQRLLEGGE